MRSFVRVFLFTIALSFLGFDGAFAKDPSLVRKQTVLKAIANHQIADFFKHGKKFGANNAQDYQQMAFHFCESSSKSSFAHTGPRTGAVFKYDLETDEFIVLSKEGVIETYFKPDPAVHGYKTNFEYFLAQYEKY